MVILAGIDLAWTSYRESGICIVEFRAGEFRNLELGARVVTPSGLAAALTDMSPDVVAAIDAPLVVTPRRDAERSLGTVFGAFKASAHSSNIELLRRTGRVAGPELGVALTEAGFSLDPGALEPEPVGRHAIEVYPHAAHVRLFGLHERIPYKRKKGRNVAFIRYQLRRYQDLLADLLDSTMPGLASQPEVEHVLDHEETGAKGAALKRLEDTLDAVTCLCVAFHAWRFGAAGLEIYGNAEDGHIAVPRVI